MPSRRLPQTDANRSKALITCARRTSTLSAGAWLITVAQNNTLNGLLSSWRNNQNAAGGGLSVQTGATSASQQCLTRTVRIISHFIQVLDMAIERGALPPSVRPLYQLNASHGGVPDINTVADALLWAQRLADGEAARINQGGAPLAWPAVSEVTAEADLLRAAADTQSTDKLLFDQAQEAIATQRPAIDTHIRDLWDTIEYNLRHEPDAASLRRKAREWGVVYINDDGSEETDEPAPAPTPVP